MKTELIALKGKVKTKPFQLGDGQRLVIGRGAEADIQVLDAGLSRGHCALERHGDDFWVADLGSRNGTWVNGSPIKRAQLKNGDQVKLGTVEFEFRCLPERRRMEADVIASVPESASSDIHEKLQVHESDLMSLSAPYQNMETFRRIQRDLATIYQIGNLISAERELDGLYGRILDVILQVVKADRAFLICLDKNGNLHTVASRERSEGSTKLGQTTYSRTIVEECFKNCTSILRSNVLEDERYQRAESIIQMDIHSVICVPMQTPDKVVGVVYADTVAEGEAFSRHDLELLLAVARQAGVAFQRLQFSEQFRQMLRGTVRALVAAIEAKDEYTKGHSERVTSYALRIGAAMRLEEPQLRMLELAGFLHDVGKIGIPESILRKAGPLTDKEYEIIKEHARTGGSIIRNIEGVSDLAEIVEHHHERWDGNGYPDGLKADEASLLSRILVVADAYDAMSSNRPYRDSLARERVIRTMQEASGKQFDPRIVEYFLQVMEDEAADEEAAKRNPRTASADKSSAHS
jgi:HD-GYP domain-containing protein (c-di-GMP phosphodiesterase class II)/pSer/pThr/pTyr-binding forkhead associated (FHA) protein